MCSASASQPSTTDSEHAMNTMHPGSRGFRRNSGRCRGRNNRQTRGRFESAAQNSWVQNSSACHPSTAGGRSRRAQAGGRGRFRLSASGVNRHGRCNYCRNSTEHGWDDRPLCIDHEQPDAPTEQANASTATVEPMTTACCTSAGSDRISSSQLALMSLMASLVSS